MISVTRPSEEHVMDVQLHGFGSRRFQLEKGGGGGGDAEEELRSHVKSVEASWFAEKARP